MAKRLTSAEVTRRARFAESRELIPAAYPSQPSLDADELWLVIAEALDLPVETEEKTS